MPSLGKKFVQHSPNCAIFQILVFPTHDFPNKLKSSHFFPPGSCVTQWCTGGQRCAHPPVQPFSTFSLTCCVPCFSQILPVIILSHFSASVSSRIYVVKATPPSLQFHVCRKYYDDSKEDLLSCPKLDFHRHPPQGSITEPQVVTATVFSPSPCSSSGSKDCLLFILLLRILPKLTQPGEVMLLRTTPSPQGDSLLS